MHFQRFSQIPKSDCTLLMHTLGAFSWNNRVPPFYALFIINDPLHFFHLIYMHAENQQICLLSPMSCYLFGGHLEIKAPVINILHAHQHTVITVS